MAPHHLNVFSSVKNAFPPWGKMPETIFGNFSLFGLLEAFWTLCNFGYPRVACKSQFRLTDRARDRPANVPGPWKYFFWDQNFFSESGGTIWRFSYWFCRSKSASWGLCLPKMSWKSNSALPIGPGIGLQMFLDPGNIFFWVQKKISESEGTILRFSY